jgi:hypothetical protein
VISLVDEDEHKPPTRLRKYPVHYKDDEDDDENYDNYQVPSPQGTFYRSLQFSQDKISNK